MVLDISYRWAFITTHLTSQKVQKPAVMSKTDVANGINERCLFLSLMALRLSSSCRFFKPNTDLTICQTCQHTTGLSSLTVGFKILVYLDQYTPMCWSKRCTCFACQSWWLWFFCQPVHCACVKMTSHVGKHETSYIC